MRNIKLVLEYDGLSFFGFQKQTRHRSVQEALETSLSQILNQKTKISAASGRTDTGVHAAYQVVNFKTNAVMKPLQLQKALNGVLPKSVAVKSLEEVSSNFHARYSAKSKIYEYTIWNHPIRSPLIASRSLHVREKLNLSKMRAGAKILMGKHDFKSFCSSNGMPQEKNSVRKISRFEIRKQGSIIQFRVEANGFLYRMVRNLVASLVELGLGKLEPEDLRKILKAKDRKRAGASAPGCGLSLVHVTY